MTTTSDVVFEETGEVFALLEKNIVFVKHEIYVRRQRTRYKKAQADPAPQKIKTVYTARSIRLEINEDEINRIKHK